MVIKRFFEKTEQNKTKRKLFASTETRAELSFSDNDNERL